ncbi:MAG: CRP-like cAMP-binding protein [Bacteroidia bacterium]|jgi:CRP-like cAMP-binding protein
MDAFKQLLNQHIEVSVDDWTIIANHLSPLSCSKNDILTKAGRVEDRLYFMVKGVVRLYYELEHKDITLNFAFPDNFVNAYTSFLTQSPSDFYISCLTDCELYYLTRSGLEALYKTTECGQELGRIFAEKLFLYLSKRENDFMIKSPTQRYLDMFEEQPHLIQEIPQKYLASYIGITPQALSRIRAKL